MTKYVKGKDGKFAGSIGDGKTAVPAAAPKLTAAQKRKEEINERVRAMNEAAAANREMYARMRAIQEDSRQAWFRLSDTLNTTYPDARWMYLSEDKETILRLEDRDHQVLVSGEDVVAELPEVKGELDTFSHHSDLVGGRYLKDGEHRVGIFFRCGVDGCDHLYYPEGMQPSHTPSQYCRSGKRPHCTCDTCF